MPIWVAFAIMVVSFAVQLALRPKAPPPPDPEKAQLPQIEEGTPIPVVFGDVWIAAPEILWYGDMSTIPIYQKAGKK